MKKLSIKQQIKNITLGRKLDVKTGFLFANANERRRKYKKITLDALFVSDEGTFLVRSHVFEKDKALTPREWEQWLAEHYGKILRENILPGMSIRTDKFWRLYRVIGILPGDRTGLASTTPRRKRNKSKRKRK